jgi:ubiquinone/menaquinone biosynthesis C-methylase UbiE
MTTQQTTKEQYSRPQNLEARISLHERFSTNKYGWHRWVFDQFVFPRGARILELGCGVGQLWLDNVDRVPVSWDVTLSDFSEAMLGKAVRNLADSGHRFSTRVIEADDISFPDGMFDAVIANHMLYYVEKKPRAFAEIRRVLKPGGRFYASTVGEQHMKELIDLATSFDSAISFLGPSVGSFTIENGVAQVAEWFEAVELRCYPDGLVVTDVAALIDYVFSLTPVIDLPDRKKEELVRIIEHRFASQNGVFEVTKVSGMICSRRGERTRGINQ